MKAEDVPFVKGSTLKFSGCGVNINFKDIKVCTVPVSLASCAHVNWHVATIAGALLASALHPARQGETIGGLVGFDKTLAEDEMAFVKENLKTLDSKEVTWSAPEGLSIFWPPINILHLTLIIFWHRGRGEDFPGGPGQFCCPLSTWAFPR